MLGSAIYGMLLAPAFMILTRVAPQPAGSLVWWTLLAGQLFWLATITWRRTALPFATGAMLAGAVGSAIVATATVLGHEFPRFPLLWAVPIYGLMAAGPACLLIESRVHRSEWLRWKAYGEQKTAIDILFGRHIPDLRSGCRGSGRTVRAR